MSRVIHFYHKEDPCYVLTNFARYPIRLKGKLWPTEAGPLGGLRGRVYSGRRAAGINAVARQG
jgi:hypothetical protein